MNVGRWPGKLPPPEGVPMRLLPDWQIQRDIKVEPFAEGPVCPAVNSCTARRRFWGYGHNAGWNLRWRPGPVVTPAPGCAGRRTRPSSGPLARAGRGVTNERVTSGEPSVPTPRKPRWAPGNAV